MNTFSILNLLLIFNVEKNHNRLKGIKCDRGLKQNISFI